jgi:hypothetical protein
MSWTKKPSTVSQDYQARHGRNPLGPLFMWATYAVEALYYLEDLDKTQANPTNSNSSHDPVTVDMAHVRWSTTTAITALDLCAAALGRCYCGWTNPDKELSLQSFKPGSRDAKALLPLLRQYPQAMKWVDDVRQDPRYEIVRAARNPLTHSRLIRHFTLIAGPSTIPDPRTAFRVNGNPIEAGTLVTTARDLAGEHVDAFLLVIDAL